MRRFGHLPGLLIVPLLAGCATVSFAPPAVNVHQVTTTPPARSAGDACLYVVRGAPGKPHEPDRTGGVPVKATEWAGGATDAQPITHDVEGARALIQNYILAYRCSAASAANGRQFFEVPSFIAATGAVLATAFGASPDVTLAAGGVGALAGGANAYYDPRRKSAIYDSALDALLCVKTEAVDVRAFIIDKADSKTEGSTAGADKGGSASGSRVTITAEKQYFDMVSAALLTIERVLTQRLSQSGNFDTAGVVAELEALNQKAATAKTRKNVASSETTQQAQDKGGARAAEPTKAPEVAVTTDTGGVLTPEAKAKLAEAKARADARPASVTPTASKEIELLLEEIQPELQKCVVRAKL